MSNFQNTTFLVVKVFKLITQIFFFFVYQLNRAVVAVSQTSNSFPLERGKVVPGFQIFYLYICQHGYVFIHIN